MSPGAKADFIGGSATWGNIRGILSHNIPDLHLYEEGSYEAPRVDVWGISDLHLFEAANRVLCEVRDKPFLAIIQTADEFVSRARVERGRP